MSMNSNIKVFTHFMGDKPEEILVYYVSKEIDDLPCIYVLFGCKVCGLPWSEHKPCCCEHKNKNKYDNLRNIARGIDKYKSLFSVASQNGWSEPEVNHGVYSFDLTSFLVKSEHAESFIARFGETVS